MASTRQTTTTKAPAKATTRKAAPKAKGASRAANDPATLPNAVRTHRMAADVSPKELAAKIGGDWTASTVRRIERGARKATPEQVAALADALRKPAKVLFPNEAAPKAAAKPVTGKRTGKVLATKADVAAEVGAILTA